MHNRMPSSRSRRLWWMVVCCGALLAAWLCAAPGWTQDVPVVSLTPPPNILTVQTDPVYTPVDLGMPSVVDEANPVVGNNAPVSKGRTVFPVGTTMVIWTLTDAVGNRLTALQRVTVAPKAAVLVAWGDNLSGQCDVPPGTYADVAAGQLHSVALQQDGSLVAWGARNKGQTDVPDGADYVAVAAGYAHSLALKTDGSLAAWGDNGLGQCNVPGETDFVAISAGKAHSVALRQNGSVIAWGDNSNGQCNVPSEADFTAISAGAYFTVALRQNGTLAAWGNNSKGQCNVPDGNKYVAISAGQNYAVALQNDGTLVAWGTQSGTLPADKDFKAVAVGGLHSVALHRDGTLTAWGSNTAGQCNPPISGGVVSIASGVMHSVALATISFTPPSHVLIRQTSADGTPVALGTPTAFDPADPAPVFTNDAPALFPVGTTLVTWTLTDVTGTTLTALQRVTVAPFAGILVAWGQDDENIGQTDAPASRDFAQVAAGDYHNIALRNDGSLVGWGDPKYGAAKVPAGRNYAAVAAGGNFSLALTTDGALKAWGDNSSGQCKVPNEHDFVAMAAGAAHAVALRADGSLVAWGANSNGQCDVPAGTDFIAVAAGISNSVALRRDGSLVAWGQQDLGECDVPPGMDFTAIGTYGSVGLALNRDGALVMWGNDQGANLAPPDEADFSAFALNESNVVAIKQDGSLAAWGQNSPISEVPFGGGFLTVSVGVAHAVALAAQPGLQPPANILVTQTGPEGATVNLGYPGFIDPFDSNPTIFNNANTDEAGNATFPVGTTLVTWTLIDSANYEVFGLQRVTVAPAAAGVVAWGNNQYGQCAAPAGLDYAAIAAGGNFTVALKQDGSLVAWGDNHYRQTNVPAGNDFVAVSAGATHAVALRQDGSLVAWGDSSNGATDVPAAADFVAIAAGAHFSLAIKHDGTLAAWGAIDSFRNIVNDGLLYKAIAAGQNFGLGLNTGDLGSETGNQVLGWGDITYGQADPPGDPDVSAIAAGDTFGLLLRNDGTLDAWGNNALGQTTVPFDTTYTAIAAGGSHALALRQDGAVDAWGDNSDGQSAPPLGTGFIAIAAGAHHSVALQLPEAPLQLQLPADIVAEALSADGAEVDFAPTASDIVDPNPVITCDPESGSVFPLGVTPVSVTATDIYGNTVTGTFNVTVADTTAPEVMINSPMADGNYENTAGLLPIDVSVFDLCDPEPMLSYTLDGQPFTDAAIDPMQLTLGTHYFTAEATDYTGNSSSQGVVFNVVPQAISGLTLSKVRIDWASVITKRKKSTLTLAARCQLPTSVKPAQLAKQGTLVITIGNTTTTRTVKPLWITTRGKAACTISLSTILDPAILNDGSGAVNVCLVMPLKTGGHLGAAKLAQCKMTSYLWVYAGK